MRALHNSEIQFNNETLWYSDIVPAFESVASKFGLDVQHLWPKFYTFVNGDLSAVVMQDLSKEDFKLAQPATELSLVHARLAMQKISLLHALSYALKTHDSDKYQHVVTSLEVL